MRIQPLFYHLLLNVAWLQANQSHQFLFAGICGCAKSVEGAGGIVINTTPQGQCQFCNRVIEMHSLYALTNKKSHQWLELYKTEEGQFATREPCFAPGIESSENNQDLHQVSQD